MATRWKCGSTHLFAIMRFASADVGHGKGQAGKGVCFCLGWTESCRYSGGVPSLELNIMAISLAAGRLYTLRFVYCSGVS